jgi:sugar phosphate isomerase/epimerase
MFKNLNLGALGFRASFFETAELAKVGGFEGIDLDINEMTEILKTKSIDEIKNINREKGLKLGGWVLPVDYRGNESKFQEDLEKLPTVAQMARELGWLRVITWIFPSSDKMPFKENFEFHAKRLRSVAEILNDHECSLGLEFIGPKTSRINGKYKFIYDITGMLKLCSAIGTSNVGILLDSWHWYTSRGTIAQIRQLKNKDVVYVHVNDAPAGIPVDEQIDSVRKMPGETGVIDIIGFMKALKKIGYDGPVTPEPFDKELKEMPIREAVKRVGRALNTIWI